MFTCSPTIVRDMQEAADHKERMKKAGAKRFEHNLAGMSFLSGIDFSKFDLDQPVGEIKTNGMQTMLSRFAKHGPKATLRQVLGDQQENWGQLVGTADFIAGEMAEAMEEIGGDGLIGGHVKPKYVTSIVDELVPVLQKRQLTRSEYGHETFRENMMAF